MISKGKRRNLVSRYRQLARIAHFRQFTVGMIGLSGNGRYYPPEVVEKALAEFAKKKHLNWDPLEIELGTQFGKTTSYLSVQRGKHRNHAPDTPGQIKYEIDWAGPKAFPHLIEAPNDQSGKTQVS